MYGLNIEVCILLVILEQLVKKKLINARLRYRIILGPSKF